MENFEQFCENIISASTLVNLHSILKIEMEYLPLRCPDLEISEKLCINLSKAICINNLRHYCKEEKAHCPTELNGSSRSFLEILEYCSEIFTHILNLHSKLIDTFIEAIFSHLHKHACYTLILVVLVLKEKLDLLKKELNKPDNILIFIDLISKYFILGHDHLKEQKNIKLASTINSVNYIKRGLGAFSSKSNIFNKRSADNIVFSPINLKNQDIEEENYEACESKNLKKERLSLGFNLTNEPRQNSDKIMHSSKYTNLIKNPKLILNLHPNSITNTKEQIGSSSQLNINYYQNTNSQIHLPNPNVNELVDQNSEQTQKQIISHKNNVVIPKLDIKQMVHDPNLLISRSSRRAEAIKSLSTRSTKISGLKNHMLNDNFAVASRQQLMRHTLENAHSIDEESISNSEEIEEKALKEISLKNLATQVGECCISAEVSSLLAYKRMLETSSPKRRLHACNFHNNPNENSEKVNKAIIILNDIERTRVSLLKIIEFFFNSVSLSEITLLEGIFNSFYVYLTSTSKISMIKSFFIDESEMILFQQYNSISSNNFENIMKSLFKENSDIHLIFVILSKYSLILQSSTKSILDNLKIKSISNLEGTLQNQTYNSVKFNQFENDQINVKQIDDENGEFISGIKYKNLAAIDKNLFLSTSPFIIRIYKKIQFILSNFTFQNDEFTIQLLMLFRLLNLLISYSYTNFVSLEIMDLFIEEIINIKKIIIDSIFAYGLFQKESNESTDRNYTANLKNIIFYNLPSYSQKNYIQFVAHFLSFVGSVFLKCQNWTLLQCLSKLFIEDVQWNNIVECFFNFLFKDTILLKAEYRKSNINIINLNHLILEDDEIVDLIIKRKGTLKIMVLCIKQSLSYYYSIAVALRKSYPKESSIESELKRNENISALAKIAVDNYLYLLEPSKGLISFYLSSITSKSEGFSIHLIIDFTHWILKMETQLLELGMKYSKYFTEFLIQFYIRNHYISFVRNYCKSLSMCSKCWGNIKKYCNLHLSCLFSISKFKKKDTSRLFRKFRVVDFFSKELDLELLEEFKINENVGNVEKVKVKEESIEKIEKIEKIERKDIPKIKIPNINLSSISLNPNLNENIIKKSSNANKEIKSDNLSKDNNSALASHKESIQGNHSDLAKNDCEVKLFKVKGGTNFNMKLDLSKINGSRFANQNYNNQNKNQSIGELSENRKSKINLIKEDESKSELGYLKDDSKMICNEEGEYVGSNKVFVPYLIIPDMNESIRNEKKRMENLSKPEEKGKLKRQNKAKLSINLSEMNKTKIEELNSQNSNINKNTIQMNPQKPEKNAAPVNSNDSLTQTINKESSKAKIKIPKLQLANLENSTSKKGINEAPRENIAIKDQMPPQNKNINKIDKEEKIEKKVLDDKRKLLSLNIQKIISNESVKSFGSDINKKSNHPLVPENSFLNFNLQIEKNKSSKHLILYEDDDLHSLWIAFLISLMIEPKRGGIDEYYGTEFPLENGIPNVFYILHFHINHPENETVVNKLFNLVSLIYPPLSGNRLLKLLYEKLLDISSFDQWNKIASGAYGIVFECGTKLYDPSRVAIKQLNFPTNIFGRNIIVDVYNEVSCLEELVNENCATEIYDYGVYNKNYYIIMKYYPLSLRNWRLKQIASSDENISLYLNIFKKVLKAIRKIHSHYMIHYDIKCDNILLEFSENLSEIRDFNIVLGDFGVSKLFLNENDEWDTKPRGTECIKSPEMVTLTINTRKDTNTYDRRKKVGTTRQSDVWSLGCLLYELITGEYLFDSSNYATFYLLLSNNNETIPPEDRMSLIHNIYIKDFINHILVRNSSCRPSLESMYQRFKHVHALLVNKAYAPSVSIMSPASSSSRRSKSLFHLLDEALQKSGEDQINLEDINENKKIIQISDYLVICPFSELLNNPYEIKRNLMATHLLIHGEIHQENIVQLYNIINIGEDYL